ncbi:unnamed protein product [Anisakis simplex]|uniref:NR LBD domain-containing protein n=1 Tax=Anisakis simplex TaxID=6269 RepID=A0A0M3KB94_ANISI|nr:unnamed protein product [Anisakis simplex]
MLSRSESSESITFQGAMNVSADPAVTFNNIGVMESVKAEDASDTAAMMVMGMSSELQQDGYAQCYKHEKKDEHPTTSELLCADVAQNSLIRRVIEGYHQLRCVRRTAESSVSRKSVIAMFSNSPQTSDATSEVLFSANQFNSNAEIDPKLCNTLAAIRESTFCAADAYYQNANVGSCAGRVASLVNIAFHIKLLRERFREAMKIVPLVNVFEADPFL